MSKSDDDQIWAAYIKNIKKLEKKALHLEKTPNAFRLQERQVEMPAHISVLHHHHTHEVHLTPVPKGFRKSLHNKPLQKLDLHNCTLEQAFQKLSTFLRLQYMQQNRYLLVITGRGFREGTGVIRQNLVKWLNAPDHVGMIVSVHEAKPEHGGAGAFYIILRKKKSNF